MCHHRSPLAGGAVGRRGSPASSENLAALSPYAQCDAARREGDGINAARACKPRLDPSPALQCNARLIPRASHGNVLRARVRRLSTAA